MGAGAGVAELQNTADNSCVPKMSIRFVSSRAERASMAPGRALESRRTELPSPSPTMGPTTPMGAGRLGTGCSFAGAGRK